MVFIMIYLKFSSSTWQKDHLSDQIVFHFIIPASIFDSILRTHVTYFWQHGYTDNLQKWQTPVIDDCWYWKCSHVRWCDLAYFIVSHCLKNMEEFSEDVFAFHFIKMKILLISTFHSVSRYKIGIINNAKRKGKNINTILCFFCSCLYNVWSYVNFFINEIKMSRVSRCFFSVSPGYTGCYWSELSKYPKNALRTQLMKYKPKFLTTWINNLILMMRFACDERKTRKITKKTWFFWLWSDWKAKIGQVIVKFQLLDHIWSRERMIIGGTSVWSMANYFSNLFCVSN